MASLSVERLPGGFLVTVDGERQVATAEHVANLISRHWSEVAHRMPAGPPQAEGRAAEQKLVDLIFSVGLTLSANTRLHGAPQETVARWIADQLRMMGYQTRPVGSCWGVLTDA